MEMVKNIGTLLSNPSTYLDSQLSCEQAKKMISLGVQRDYSQDKLEKATYLHECF
jgi:hypothetical protein